MAVELDRDATKPPLIGEVLANRYRIESQIGEGAMGTVYRASHVKVGRAFAVKVLHSRLLEDDKQLQRFEREAELAGRLHHPNVIGVVDVGETPDGMRYMVMDFAEGPDLATLLSEAPMPAPRVIHLVRQLLEGLFHAHEQGLIHRDFKPENVIVERDSHGNEVPRIVDFGIAILREGGESHSGPGRLTTNGLVLGTPHYMAPEQAVADPIDHRIDLFALGIIVYEMLCGKLPFEGNGADVARANLLLDPPPIAQRVPHLEVDPLLEAFARKLMAKKRELRPATAKAARELLDLIERDRDAAAAALGIPPPTARTPLPTQPSAPVRHAGTGNETYPPPVSARVEAATKIESPVGAKPVPAPRGGRLDTTSTEQIAARRRTPLIVAAVAGASVLAVAAVVVLRGAGAGGRPAATSDHASVAPESTETPTPVAPQPPPPVASIAPRAAGEPADSNTPEAPAGPDETRSEPKLDDAKLRSTTRATRTTAATKPTTRSQVATIETKPADAKPADAKPADAKPADAKPADAKPADMKPADTKPAAAEPIDSKTLASQYQAVGAQLKALEQAKGQDAVSDLWPRYRIIRIADAMSTQQKRDEAASILAKLASEISARKQ